MPKKILIVEDDALIAMTLAQDLEDAGYMIAGPCINVIQALHTLKEHTIDAAVLDLHLGGDTSEEIAVALQTAGIPFVVVSGYDENAFPAPFSNAPKLDKPLQFRQLIAFLETC